MSPSFISEKNIARGSFEELEIEKDFYVLTYRNESGVFEALEREIDSSFIQFHYCVKGSSKFVFNEGRYALDIQDENSLLLYNRSEEHTSELQSRENLVCRLLLEKKRK